MSSSGDQLTASERAIDSYLEELLEEDSGAEDNDGPALDRYRVFELSGLAVALPASRVREELPCPPLQEQEASMRPAWLRRSTHGEEELFIVDTALLVLPPDLLPEKMPAGERCGRVLILADGCWGIGLPGPAHEEVIEAGHVCWRGPRGKRPWLAGTLAETRCVLLDLDNIKRLAQAGDA